MLNQPIHGMAYFGITGIEWSQEINEQEAIYSLDEESIFLYEDCEDLSDEECQEWENRLQ